MLDVTLESIYLIIISMDFAKIPRILCFYSSSNETLTNNPPNNRVGNSQTIVEHFIYIVDTFLRYYRSKFYLIFSF